MMTRLPGGYLDGYLAPVVLDFGLGEQFRFCVLASFSQADRLAYLQLSEPPADVSMQNLPEPVAACWPMLELLLDEPIAPDCGVVVCALAIDRPATSAAMAVRVVNVFISLLLAMND